jgi:hypothetical protein
LQGSEVAAPGDPVIDAPVAPNNELAVAIVMIDESGVVVIDTADIIDIREFLNKGGAGGGALQVYRNNILMLRPDPQAPVDDTVYINPGRYTRSDGLLVIDKSVGFSSGSFAPVTAPGQVRYDMLAMDDSGNPQITQGIEVASPGDPFANQPNIPANQLAIAIVRVNETSSVAIDDVDITDIREFLNKGGGGSGAGPGGAQVSFRECYIAAQGQTVFVLSHAYVPGSYALSVFRNGNKQNPDVDYVESAPTVVTFNFPLQEDERVEFIQYGGIGSSIAAARYDVDAVSSQTVYTLPFTYLPGNNELIIHAGGVLLKPGDDYTESSPSEITLLAAPEDGERITVIRLGANTSGAVKLHERQLAASGQTVFTLAGTYPVGSYALEVFQEGKRLISGFDYTETDPNTVTLLTPATLNDELLFYVAGGDTVGSACASLRWHFVTAGGGETNFVLPFTYVMGGHALIVYRAGQYQITGVDYNEISQTEVQFLTPAAPGENYVFMNISDTCCDAGAFVLPPHAPTHEDGGSDEINVTDLSGELADVQKPKINPLTQSVSIEDTDELAMYDQSETDNRKIDMATLKNYILPIGAGGPESTTGYTSVQIEPTFLIIHAGTALTTTGGDSIYFPANSVTNPAGVVGAGGRDAGSWVTGWWSLYAIKNPTTSVVTGLVSLNAATPALPAGYTLYKKIGVVYNNGGNMYRGFINGQWYISQSYHQWFSGNAPGWTVTYPTVPTSIVMGMVYKITAWGDYGCDPTTQVNVSPIASPSTTVWPVRYVWSSGAGLGLGSGVYCYTRHEFDAFMANYGFLTTPQAYVWTGASGGNAWITLAWKAFTMKL